MRKRKVTGLLKYGKIYSGNKPAKLQYGGAFLAKDYDWRDDPYEKELARNKLLQQRTDAQAKRYRDAAKARAASGKTVKPPTIGKFAAIEGGLDGSRKAANAQFNQAQEQYFTAVAQDPDWALSVDGQRAHQRISNMGSQLQSKIKAEKEVYDDAYSRMDNDDRAALAISKNGQMFVATTKGFDFIDMKTYLTDPKKYEVANMGEFAHWKQSVDTSMDSNNTTQFLSQGAVGDITFRKDFLDDTAGKLQYEIDLTKGKGVKVAGAQGDYIADDARFSKDLDMLATGDYTLPEGAVGVKRYTPDASIREVVSKVYKSIITGSKDSDRMLASLRSEVLFDGRNRQALIKVPPAEREQALHKMVQAALIRKVYDLNYDKELKNSEGTSTTPDMGKSPPPSSNPYYNSMNTLVRSGEVQDNYVVGKTWESEVGTQAQVSDLILPASRNAIPSQQLEINADPKAGENALKSNNLLSNPFLGGVAKLDINNIYIENGTKFTDVMQGENNARDYLKNAATLAPDTPVAMVLMPIGKDGKFKLKEALKLKDIKEGVKNDFIRSVSKYETIATSARDLVGSSTSTDQVKADLARYNSWLQKGTAAESEKYRKIFENTPSSNVAAKKEARRNWLESKDAKEANENAENQIKGIMGETQLKPFYKVDVLINDDGRMKFMDGYENSVKATGIGKGYIKEASATEDDYMEKFKKDNSSWFTSRKVFDENFRVSMLVPARPSSDVAGLKGEKTEAMAGLRRVDEAITAKINDSSILVTQSIDNMMMFLYN